jgi:serine/threonine-protein kinase RsbW
MTPVRSAEPAARPMPPTHTACRQDEPRISTFHFCGIADPDDVRNILAEVTRSIPGHLLHDTMPVFELVLAEVLNNIVEHAFAGQPDGRIDIDITAAQSGVTCCIQDNGRAMPGEVLPGGNLPDIRVAVPDLPEGGFGWHLIRSLTSDLTYARTGDGNSLRFTVSSG